MPPAARVGDLHHCPQQTTSVPPVPHVGGPIMPGPPSGVLIGGLPAACLGDSLTCTGPPDTIAAGSKSVLIGGRPAARLGDATAHGGMIIAGFLQVLIGG